MILPKRLAGKPHKAHQRAPKQEKELAKRIGGKTVRGSGCGSEKGDVRIKGVARLEAKTTSHASFSITRDMVRKIETAAMSCGEVPAIVVEFLSKDGKPMHEVAVVPTWVLNSLTSV
jgi:hypothetical protein